jgi:tetratricopeptide (TPR) repeat protein
MIRVGIALSLVAFTGSFAIAAPTSKLAVTPAKALNKLAQLDGRNADFTNDEDRLLDDARHGKFDRFSFTEACLIAGGIADPRERKKYLEKLDSIEADARKATAGSKSVAEDGARLLKSLHAGPMAKGYQSEQTDLHVLLDSGKFNCVSSAVLYTVTGQRLGIDVRAVELPEHVFSVLVTRDRKIDVETTASNGFDMDPMRRDGPAKTNRPSAKRREVGPPGLAGIIAFNHGVALARDKRYAESIRAYILAIGLDPDNRDAVTCMVANFDRWTRELAKSKKFEKAMAVVSVRHEISPTATGLREISRAVCVLWANEYLERYDWNGAAQIYSRGLREFPDDESLSELLAICRRNIR